MRSVPAEHGGPAAAAAAGSGKGDSDEHHSASIDVNPASGASGSVSGSASNSCGAAEGSAARNNDTESITEWIDVEADSNGKDLESESNSDLFGTERGEETQPNAGIYADSDDVDDAFGGSASDGGAVSYTHLTLPTICSV